MTPTETILLRPIQSSDEAFLRSVYASTRQQELDQVTWSPGQRESFLKGQFDAQHLHYTRNYPGAELNLIERNGEPAGRLYLHRTASEIRIMDIALIDGARGNGVGSSLLRQIIEEADQLNKPVTIHVEKWNPALGLYERLGFRQAADRGAYFFMERPPRGMAVGAA